MAISGHLPHETISQSSTTSHLRLPRSPLPSARLISQDPAATLNGPPVLASLSLGVRLPKWTLKLDSGSWRVADWFGGVNCRRARGLRNGLRGGDARLASDDDHLTPFVS
jgi:hypothetical protein